MPEDPKPTRASPQPSTLAERAGRVLCTRVTAAAERPGLTRSVVVVSHIAAVGLSRTNIPRMAAALAYRTIFGLLPVLIIGLVVLRAFANPDEVTRRLRSVLRFAGFDQIAIDASRDAEFVGPMPLTPVEAGVDEWLQTLVERVMSIPWGAIGLVGLAMLIYAAISMVVEIEKSFNTVCNAPEGRSWTRRVPLYWTLLTLGTLSLVASFGMTEAATRWIQTRIADGFMSTAAASVGTVLAYVFSILIGAATFVVMYTTVPNTRVPIRSAALGALVAAVLWEAGKAGFTAYLSFSTKVSRMYGALGLLPLFLLWVYVTWIIVLFGLQIAYSSHAARTLSGTHLAGSVLRSLGLMPASGVWGEGADAGARSRVVDPAWIVGAAIAVAKRFKAGSPSTPDQAARELDLDADIVAGMLDRLSAAGVLHRVASEGDAAYALARPAESIAVSELLRVGEDVAGTPRHAAPRFMQELLRARHTAMSGRTLADLLDPWPTPATGGGPARAPVALAPAAVENHP